MERWTDLVRADWAANVGDPRSRYVLTLFRLCTALAEHGPRSRTLSRPLRALYRVTAHWVLGIELPIGARIGPGLRILHGYGIVVSPECVMGRDCVLKHGCTIGHRTAETGGRRAPILGDRVNLAPGVQVLGPVLIGDDAQLGPSAVVLDDVPAGGLAVGNPAVVVRVYGERTGQPV